MPEAGAMVDLEPATTGAAPLALREVADLLGLHYMTVYRYVRSGRLPATKVADEWRVDPADLSALRPVPAKGRKTAPDRDEVSRRLESRLVVGDESGAWGVVDAAMAAGAPPEAVLTELLAPALHRIGERWAAGAIEIADEHRASAVANRLISRLGPHFVRPGRRRGTVVLGSVAGDRHSLPTAIMGDLLRGAGFDVLDLGADTPAESFVSTAAGVDRLVAVGMCVSDPDLLDAVRVQVSEVRDALPGLALLVGGNAVDSAEVAASVGSDGWADSPDAVVELFASMAAASVD
jgi:excisionase family DNA binding protein